MSVVDRILWIYVQRSYLGTTDVAIGGDNGLYLPGEKHDGRLAGSVAPVFEPSCSRYVQYEYVNF